MKFIYACTDPEKAFGFSHQLTESLIVISYDYDKKAAKLFEENLTKYYSLSGLVSPENLPNRNTHSLLKHEEIKKILKNFKESKLLVFKNNGRIAKFCQENKIELLAPDHSLIRKIENKSNLSKYIAQDNTIEFINTDTQANYAELVEKFQSEKFIAQFPHGNTGETTQLIKNKTDWQQLSPEKKQRVKCTKFLDSQTYTANGYIGKSESFVTAVSKQLSDPKLADNPFATVGNDWNTKFNNEQLVNLHKALNHISKKLRKAKFFGYFGIDFFFIANNVKVIEINPRQTASVSMELALFKKLQIINPMIEELNGEGELETDDYYADVRDFSMPAFQFVYRKKLAPNSLKSTNLNLLKHENVIYSKIKTGNTHNEEKVRVQSLEEFKEDKIDKFLEKINENA